MKPGAWILAILSIVLLLQPLFESLGAEPVYPSCSLSEIMEPDCDMSACTDDGSAEEENECVPKECNPFMGCSSGNFYAHYYWTISIHSLIIPKQKISPVDDNRLIEQVSDFFQPPEYRTQS